MTTPADFFDLASETRGGREDIFRKRLAAMGGLSPFQTRIAQRGFGRQNAAFFLNALNLFKGQSDATFLGEEGAPPPPDIQGDFRQFLGGPRSGAAAQPSLAGLRSLFENPRDPLTDPFGQAGARNLLDDNEGIIGDVVGGGLPGLLRSAIQSAITRRISAARDTNPTRSAFEIIFGIEPQASSTGA